jgi:peptidoglycan/xylan/chitin deacetylase (PgdA/CDA1 family)
VLLHDGDELRHGSDRSQTVEALPRIIEGLQAQGYRFVTVPQMLKVPAYQMPEAVP